MWFPVSCAGCGADGASPCRACLAALVPAPRLDVPPGLDELAALVAYDDASRPFVTGAKYRNARAAFAALAPALASLVPTLRPGAVVTWAPTSPARRRARGFDQAQLLASAVAARTALPARHLLGRSGGPPQTGRSRAERLEGPELYVRGPVPPEVVVVDDVCTTGATLAAAAAVLRSAGAHRVVGAVLARTPDRVGVAADAAAPPPGAGHGGEGER